MYELNKNELEFIKKMKGYKCPVKLSVEKKRKLHPITCLLNECDFSIQKFEVRLGLHPGSVMSAIHRAGHKKAEAYLAEFLEKPLAALWPHKYDPEFYTELEKIELENAVKNVQHPLFPQSANEGEDWSEDDIRDAFIFKTGKPIRLHVESEHVNRAIKGNSIKGETVIADVIGVEPYVIWPTRYRKRRVSKVSLPGGMKL